MWINPLFQADTRAALNRLASSDSLATVIVEHPLRIAHLPVLVEDHGDRGVELVGHVPLADPVSSAVDEGARVTCVFHGPRAYVSAGWYESVGLPTYNFAVAHLSGPGERLTQHELRTHLLDLISVHEQTKQPAGEPAWQLGEAAEQRLSRLLPLVAGFRVRVDQAQAKEKLGQNRSEIDRLTTISRLNESSDFEHHDLSKMMSVRESADE